MAQIIAMGIQPLTDEAASAAIDVVDIMTATVYGIDAIDVTDTVRRVWQQYLAQNYPMLPGPAQQWFASAPLTLATIRTQLPQLPPQQRAALVQQWSMQVPALVQMIAPAFYFAQQAMNPVMHAAMQQPLPQPAMDLEDSMVRETTQETADAWVQYRKWAQDLARQDAERAAQPVQAPPGVDPQAWAINQLNQIRATGNMLATGSTAMTRNTINLGRAYNGVAPLKPWEGPR